MTDDTSAWIAMVVLAFILGYASAKLRLPRLVFVRRSRKRPYGG
jgi:hypothetical protein